ncbi:MAG: hypothetical protein KKH44_06785 [Bacteroidetes bacterium]|nr:hypothetical protein [Bacteroidota bacterium]
MKKLAKLFLSVAVAGTMVNVYAYDSSQVGLISKMKQEAIEVSKQEAVKVFNSFGVERCNPMENPEIIEPQFGTIAATIGDYQKIVNLQNPIPALTTIVKMRCVNKTQGRKTEMYFQVILGLDEEFDMWRCRAATSITTFDESGNTAIGYEKDYSYGKPNRIAELKQECNFSK